MPSTLWEDIKRTVKEGVSVAAEKTEEYTKIGKVKVDVLNIKRNIEKLYEDLGKAVYELVSSGKKADLASNTKVETLVKKLDDQKEILKKKEDEIEAIKKEVSKKAKSRKEAQKKDEEGAKVEPVKAGKESAGKAQSKSTAKPKPKPKTSTSGKTKSGA